MITTLHSNEAYSSQLSGSVLSQSRKAEENKASPAEGLLAKLRDAPKPAPAATGRTDMLAAERYSLAERFSLELTTQEGDKVTVTFDRASRYEASIGASADRSGAAAAFSISRSERSDYQFSIEGDLNDEELAAIEHLVKDVNEIASDFFGGDIQAAFAQAAEFEMDASQLAGMALHMSRSEQYSAVQAYQQVQEQGDDSKPGRRLGHMLQGLNDSLRQPGLNFLQDAFDAGRHLLDGLIVQDLRYKDAGEEQQEQYDRNSTRLSDMLSQLFSDTE